MSCSINRFKAGGRCSGDSSVKQKVGGLSIADIISAREKQDRMWSSPVEKTKNDLQVVAKKTTFQSDIELIIGGD